jgi:ankyrin repeat protein
MKSDINKKDPSGLTPLRWAALSENLTAAKWLIKHGADVHDGNTLLHDVAALGKIETMQFFLDHGGYREMVNDEKETPLFLAQEYHPSMAKFLIENNVNVNHQNVYKDTILHRLCCANDPESFDLFCFLLKRNVRVNSKNKKGNTPLLILCRLTTLEHSTEMLEMLLEKGADPFVQNANGKTVLHFLVRQPEFPEKFSLFFQYSALIHARDCWGRTPLHRVFTIKGVKLLLENHAKVDARDSNSRTPLHLLMKKLPPDALAIAEVMLAYGADVNAIDHWGQIPLHNIPDQDTFSTRKKPLYIALPLIELLVKKGSDINKQRDGSWWAKGHFTPLHVAAYQGEREMAELLLQLGADPTVTAEGKSAYQVAIDRGHGKIAKLILQKEREVLH